NVITWGRTTRCPNTSETLLVGKAYSFLGHYGLYIDVLKIFHGFPLAYEWLQQYFIHIQHLTKNQIKLLIIILPKKYYLSF
ncbi:hypothetical protein ACJX0J_039150, partial [Zea mays]